MPLTFILIVGLVFGQVASEVAASPQGLPTDLATLRQKAEAGDAEAQFRLGKAFEDGSGVSQSDEEAAKWYEKSATKGNAAAQLELGVLLWTGRGVTKDKAQAVEWYRKAAKQGNGGAMFNLGTAYYNGEGVTRTSELQAFVWFLLAQDHASTLGTEAIQRSEKTIPEGKLIDTYKQIAATYVQGDEIPQDYVAAAKWYKKAALRGDASSAANLGKILAGAGAFDQALSWCRFAADKKNGAGMSCMGLLYQEGKGVEKDMTTARQWFEEGASYGSLESSLRLGHIFWDGGGVIADKVAAYKWALVASAIQPKADQEAQQFRQTMSAEEIQTGKESARKYLERTQIVALPKPRILTVCELLANAKDLVGKTVVLDAILVSNGEFSAFKDGSCKPKPAEVDGKEPLILASFSESHDDVNSSASKNLKNLLKRQHQAGVRVVGMFTDPGHYFGNQLCCRYQLDVLHIVSVEQD